MEWDLFSLEIKKTTTVVVFILNESELLRACLIGINPNPVLPEFFYSFCNKLIK